MIRNKHWLHNALDRHPANEFDCKQSHDPKYPHYKLPHELGTGPHLATTSNRWDSGYECHFCGGEMERPKCVSLFLTFILAQRWWVEMRPLYDKVLAQLGDGDG